MEPQEEFASAVGSPDGSESAVESGDDSNLTIRIPNPKMYMARQSQWKGRRGKPRCDHCRMNNLKVCICVPRSIRGDLTAASATGFFPRAIIVHGLTEGNASILLFPLRHIGAYRDATAVV
jgi:hypothetical protein